MTSSHERKAMGLQLFCVLLPHLGAANVPVVFSGQFMRTIANNLKGKDRYLHKGATRCINRLVDWAEASHAGGSGGACTKFDSYRSWCCGLQQCSWTRCLAHARALQRSCTHHRTCAGRD
jgi:DNA polymerase phi